MREADFASVVIFVYLKNTTGAKIASIEKQMANGTLVPVN